MEKTPHREQYENLLAKQEGERAGLRDEAHGEALAMEQGTGEHEAKIKELKRTLESEIKGTFESQNENPVSKEKLEYRVVELPEMVGRDPSAVEEYLKNMYGEAVTHVRIPEDPSELPENFKDGNRYWFFGSKRRIWFYDLAYFAPVPNKVMEPRIRKFPNRPRFLGGGWGHNDRAVLG